MLLNVQILMQQIKVIFKCPFFPSRPFLLILDLKEPLFIEFVNLLVMLLLKVQIQGLLILELDPQILDHLVHAVFVLSRLRFDLLVQLLEHPRFIAQHFRLITLCLYKLFIPLM